MFNQLFYSGAMCIAYTLQLNLHTPFAISNITVIVRSFVPHTCDKNNKRRDGIGLISSIDSYFKHQQSIHSVSQVKSVSVAPTPCNFSFHSLENLQRIFYAADYCHGHPQKCNEQRDFDILTVTKAIMKPFCHRLN